MQKLVIDCTTGEESYIDFTEEEIALREVDEAVIAAKILAKEQLEIEKLQKEADIEAMLTEWRLSKA